MAQEISSKDGVLHVCDNEGPLDQAEGAHTVGHNSVAVGSL